MDEDDKIQKMYNDDHNSPYDEDGYAKSLPADDPHRELTEALLIMTGQRERINQEKFRNRTDYSEDFKMFAEHYKLPAGEYKVTKSENPEARSIKMECETTFEGQRYRSIVEVDWKLVDDYKKFDELKYRLLSELAYRMRRYLPGANPVHRDFFR